MSRSPGPSARSMVAYRLPVQEQRVVDSVLRSILEQRIQPGTKLGEDALAEIFGVSRTRIRRVLLSLSHLGVVDLKPNRGAFVAEPTDDDARDIFDARRSIETLILERIAQRMTAQKMDHLRSHLRAEWNALRFSHREEAIRLSGEFHLLLARLSESPILYHLFERLIPISSLIVILFGNPEVSCCSVEEHSAVIDEIEIGDIAKARDVMMHHLDHLEGALILDRKQKKQHDLKNVFNHNEPLLAEHFETGIAKAR